MALRSLRTCALELQKQLAATSFNKTTSLGGFGHKKIGAVAQVTARLYHETVIDHYENPRNVGSFDKKDKNVGTGLVGAPACGDVMKLQIKVSSGVRRNERTEQKQKQKQKQNRRQTNQKQLFRLLSLSIFFFLSLKNPKMLLG